MALDDKSILNNKLSPLIEGQVPDFVQSDHPIFVEFLKDYYKFLEAGELTITTTVAYISLETETSSYILSEDDGDRVVTEIGAGTQGYFIENETITGTTSRATAQVLVDNSRKSKLFVTSQQKFITGETITGETSGSSGIVEEYRGNPVQNIQQMLDYADVDNTIYDFLDKMRDSFMVNIPDDLASGVSKRDILKNIKDLYAAKGTSEGHKLFMRMLLGETADIFYPNQYMMKSSSGRWEGETVLRVLAFPNVTGEEVINQIVTGETSGATATIVTSIVSQQTKNNFNDSVTEFALNNVVGTFSDSEIVSATSTTSGRLVKFTVFGIVSNIEILENNTTGGALYSKDEIIDLEVLGNNFAEVVVEEVTLGKIEEAVIIDSVGTGYSVGDIVTFTSNALDVKSKPATGEVAMIGGGILQETGTVSLFKSLTPDDSIVMEFATDETLTNFNLILEETIEDRIISDGSSTVYSLTNLSATADTLVVNINNLPYAATIFTNNRDVAFTNWTASGTSLTFTSPPLAGVEITVRSSDTDFLLLDRTDIVGGVTGTGTTAVGGSDSGYKVESNSSDILQDLLEVTSRNKMVLEYDTFENLGVTSERGSIQRIRVNRIEDENSGYSKLPSVTISSIDGTGAKALALPRDIGRVKSVKINNNGFRYSNTNPPDINFKSHFILKDVTGTFAANNSLTSHIGKVTSWDTTTNELVLQNFDNTQKLVQEQDGVFNEGIQLEQGTQLLIPSGFRLEDEQSPLPTGFILDRGDYRNSQDASIKDIFDSREVGYGRVSRYDDEWWLFPQPGAEIELLEPALRDALISRVPSEDQFGIDDRIVFDSTGLDDPYEFVRNPWDRRFCGVGRFDSGSIATTEKVIIKVTAEWNEVSSTWAFSLNGKSQKNMTFYEGTEYYFDLSHPSLYGNESGQPIQFLQKSFAFSLTPDGRNTDGTNATRETTNITTTQNFGTGGRSDITRIGLGNEDSLSWLPPPNSPQSVKPNSFSLTRPPTHIWTPSDYDLAQAPSYFDESSPQGFNDRSLLAQSDTWTPDERYAIQMGYTGAYLKLNIPLFSSSSGKLYYYSPNFDTMGGVITIKRKPKTLIDEGSLIKINAEAKEEYGLILENGSQDRIIGVDEESRATDLLVMEDARDTVDTIVKEDFERAILRSREFDTSGTLISTTVSDSSYLSLYYRTETFNAASNFDQYINYLNQSYEPTYFMDESYEPPASRRPFVCVMPSPGRSGIPRTPSARDFIIPERKESIGQLNKEVARLLGRTTPNQFRGGSSSSIAYSGFNQFHFPKITSNSNGSLLLDSFRENDSGFIVLDGTDANGSDAGSLVASEEFGNTLILNSTDAASSNAGEGFLLDDETGDGNILLDSADIDVDIGDELILEETLVWQNGIVLTDSSGASGTVSYVNQALGSSIVSAVSEKSSAYRGINNLIGEDLVRLQDSFYYQDYSYEVVVGQSLLTYFDELKKAVHPAGFRPFGRVSIATLVSAAITNTAAGVSDYAGDTKTFSPILGSVLETIFSQVLQSRLQVPSTVTADGTVPIGSRDDRIVQETGVLPGENLVLDASAASTDVGSNLLLEDGDGLDLELGLTTAGDGSFLYEISTITYTDDITNGTGDGGGRIMAETSHAPSGNSDRSLVTQRVTKIESRPLPRFERNLLLYLAESPFGLEPAGITLETGSGNLVDNIIMDGEIPFNEGNAFMELERDSEIDNILLDGTDTLGTNAGEGLILETGFFLKIEDPSLGRESETFDILFEDSGKLQLEGSIWAFPIGYHVSNGDKLLLDTLDNDETIPLSDISSLTFEQIRTIEKFEIQGLNANEENWGGGTDDDNITMEDFGQILLDRSTDEGADAGSHLLQETSKRNRFTLEESGTLIVEDYSTLSNVAALTLEDGAETGDIILESTLQGVEAFNIKLEDDDNLQGIIVLNGTDSAASDAGDKLDLELVFNELPNIHILALEEYNVFTNEGQIPAVNFRLNSTEVITKGNVRSAEISARSTGDIALEDSTDDTHGYLVLNSTSGSSTNAGENFDLEGATGITY